MKKATSLLVLAAFLLLLQPANAQTNEFTLVVDPNVTRDQVVIGKIKSDVATQFAIFESYFGTKSLDFKIIVYPTFKSVSQKFTLIQDPKTLNLVLPGYFYKSIAKTRTIYNELLASLWPGSSLNTRLAISEFLSNEFYGVDSTQLASLSRYSFHDIPLPQSIDRPVLHPSIIDRLAAKFKKIALNEGNASLGFFLQKALENSLESSIFDKYGQDFKSFIRSAALNPIPKNFDKDLFTSIYKTQIDLWKGMPSNPIPLDTAWRDDSQSKLELAKILFLRDSKDEVKPIILETELTLKAEKAESSVWWYISAILFLIVLFCFGITLQLSASYGTIRHHKKEALPAPPKEINKVEPTNSQKSFLVADSPIHKPRFRGRPATRTDIRPKGSNDSKRRGRK